jgi:hypothetical protein
VSRRSTLRAVSIMAAALCAASSASITGVLQRTGRDTGPPEVSPSSRGGKVKAQWKRETRKGKR